VRRADERDAEWRKTMNELQALLARDEWPEFGTVGRELGWFPLATLPLPSGELWAGDPDFSWAELRSGDFERVHLPSGDYELSAAVMEFAQGNFVARLRVCRSGVASTELGGQLAEVGTDSAAIGVGDAQELWKAFQARFGEDSDAPVLFLEDFDYQRCGVLKPGGDAGAALVYVNSGFGDGGYPVIELLAGDERVGVELPFIEPEGTT
jgi:hypothetical protein